MTTFRNILNPTNKMVLMTGVTTVLAGGVLAGSQPASAVSIGDPYDSDEPTLQDELDNTVDPDNLDAEADQTGEELFTHTTAGSSVNLAFENADMADNNSFGIYKAGAPGTQATLINGNAGTPITGLGRGAGSTDISFLHDGDNSVAADLYVNGTKEVDNFGSEFGFFLNNGNDKTFYSEAALNPGGKQQSVIYQGDEDMDAETPNIAEGAFTETDRIVAFEDLQRYGGNSDSDFNDLGVVVSDVEEANVPEPSAMAALGLVGGVMTFMRRRRQ
jgi:hypothetical protein